MHKYAGWAFMLLCGGALAFSGCAKQEVVKKDEQVVPVSATVTEPLVKAESVKEQPVKQVPVQDSEARGTLAPIPQAGELKARLDNIYFGFDSHTLSQEARDILAKTPVS